VEIHQSRLAKLSMNYISFRGSETVNSVTPGRRNVESEYLGSVAQHSIKGSDAVDIWINYAEVIRLDSLKNVE
jgi:hypothetical protein